MDIHSKIMQVSNALGKKLARNERGFICTAMAEIFALVYHICLLIFAFVMGIKPLFYFNIFSVTWFCTSMFILFSRKKLSVVFFMTIFEVVLHQILADYILGSYAGFHFLIMILVIYPFLVERKEFNVGIPFAFICILIFFGCEFIFSRTAPLYVLDEKIIRNLRLTNIIASMSVILTLVIIFKLIIGYIEHGMEKLNQENENLLENILPKKIIEELRSNGYSDPEQFESVSVLFTDIVHFTDTSKKLQPSILIEELNDIFTNFDMIMDEYKCVRIKTIGDAYMAVSGLPEKNPSHLQNLISAALECRDYLAKRNETAKIEWKIRLGINFGCVVAGIVGVKKYLYDVFGDTVNVASRMETSSEEMKLCVPESVYTQLKDVFDFTFRGEFNIKGKGMMKLYFVENKNRLHEG